jgi:hypothetical protein
MCRYAEHVGVTLGIVEAARQEAIAALGRGGADRVETLPRLPARRRLDSRSASHTVLPDVTA